MGFFKALGGGSELGGLGLFSALGLSGWLLGGVSTPLKQAPIATKVFGDGVDAEGSQLLSKEA